MEPFHGTITVEYYEESSDFSESDASEDALHQSPKSSSPSSSTSLQLKRDSISCKTYDFKHAGSETDQNETEVSSIIKRKLFPDAARQAMSNHVEITHRERTQSLVHPKASFPRCPRGDVPEQYGRRKHPGPFLTCSFSHSHECGDDFLRIPISTKPSAEFDTFTRPQHLKEKKAKFFKQCKHCETIGFTHHRNPARHYEDYLNNVTYRQHNEHTKVWQQHVVDLMFMNGEDSTNVLSFDASILEKCKHYKPSEAIVKATRNSRSSQRRITTVITRKRAAIARPLRRPPVKTNASMLKASSSANPANTRSSVPERRQTVLSEANQRKFLNDADDHSCRLVEPTARNARGQRMPKEMQLHPRRRSPSNDINIDRQKTNDLQQNLKAPLTNLINSRQASSKASMRFVNKSEPPKEVKYIQRGKPNISAKFLRARSKSKILKSPRLRSNVSSPATGPGKRKSLVMRKSRSVQLKTGRVFGQFDSKYESDHSKRDSSDDESYAKYRDQNGDFDVEKYRQSILKMLSSNIRSGARRKKKKMKRSANSSKANFVTLPKVKNSYRNVQPRIATNFTQRKRRKVRKLKRESEFDFQIPSDVSINSKYWNEDSVTSKNSYFSIPSV